MNISITGGVVVNSAERIVKVNNKIIPFHPKMTGNSLSTVGQVVYIDGFKLVDDRWIRTPMAIWHKYF